MAEASLLTPTLDQVIEGQLDELMKVAALAPRLQDRVREARRLLTAKALNRPLADRYPGLSQINPSGLPFQWSFCIGQPPSLRFLCEIGPPGSNCAARHQRSIAAIESALDVLGIPSPDWFWEQVLPEILPGSPSMPEGWQTSIWTALGARGDVAFIKIYASLEQGDAEARWRRIGRTLLALDRFEALQLLCDISGQVSGTAIPVGLAVDVMPNGAPGRVKAYFQSGAIGRDAVTQWYHAANLARDLPALTALLLAFPRPEHGMYPPSAFFMSAEFDRESALTLKTDLTVSRWCASDAVISGGIERLCNNLGIDQAPFKEAQKALGRWPPSPSPRPLQHVVGLGSERDGHHHVNVYMEPPAR